MEALLFIVGLLVGAAVAGLVVQRIMAKRIALLQQQVEIRFKLESELEAARARQEMYVQQMERQTEQLERQTEQIKELETENKDKRALAEALAKEVEMLKKQAAEVARIRDEQFAKETQLRKEQFEEQLETARQQMTNVARQLLEQNATKLNEQNTEGMQHITKPLRDALEEMRRALHENAKEQAGHSASFREQIRLMVESNREIGERAASLVNVLRKDNKVAGNMGEIILGDLLASQGLTEGIHYEVQARLRDELGKNIKNDETGKEMQPDVILHYPQGQDAVIDSKVSLVAYERYVNATDATEKEQYLQEHLRSVRSHVNELARKDYSKYIRAPRHAIDFVIMFVPFESSLQLALANDATLWRDAFERKVFICGEQNLLGILHIIHIAWVQYTQAENQQKVFGLAEQLIDRLGDFAKRYNDVGEAIAKVQKAYDYANNKLSVGAQSVMKKGKELVELGAKENPNRKLPVADC